MHNYDDCSFCGGKVDSQHVELDYRYHKKLYVFKDVPAGVCSQCGEKYLTADVSREIESRILDNRAWRETMTVPVSTFKHKEAV